jgi:hypothetical protein
MDEHREREFVGDAVGRVAEQAQRFARSEERRIIGLRGGLRMQAPDHRRRVRHQFSRRIDDGGFFIRRQPPL